MHDSVKNLGDINKEISLKVKENISPKVIAVSKTFKMSQILPLIKYGHLHFGENKVQEAIEKWQNIKNEYPNIRLHLIGGLQTNKVKLAVKLFDYIHSLDNEKLAKKISEEQIKQKKKVKIFIQVNLGEEEQKSGILKKNLKSFFDLCQNLNLDIIGLMCIPPQFKPTKPFFDELNFLNKELKLKELSIGMSADYISALESSATYLRIGSKIFGERNIKF
jgi:PLP dependent protein